MIILRATPVIPPETIHMYDPEHGFREVGRIIR
jgi:hypothetical protein